MTLIKYSLRLVTLGNTCGISSATLVKNLNSILISFASILSTAVKILQYIERKNTNVTKVIAYFFGSGLWASSPVYSGCWPGGGMACLHLAMKKTINTTLVAKATNDKLRFA